MQAVEGPFCDFKSKSYSSISCRILCLPSTYTWCDLGQTHCSIRHLLALRKTETRSVASCKICHLLITGVVDTEETVVVDDVVAWDVPEDVVACVVVDRGGGGGIVVVGGGGVGNAGLRGFRKMRLFKSDAMKVIPNTGMMVSKSSLVCLAVLSTNWSNVSRASSNSKA